MVNITRLKGALKAHSIKPETAARAMGIHPATYYRRLNKKSPKFTVDEVSKLSELLNLEPKEMEAIFFDRELADK